MQLSSSIKIRIAVLVYLLAGFLITLQSIYYSGHSETTIPMSYNNYRIFKASAVHLLHHQDLYQAYPSSHWDLYKYSPTFALLFTPFQVLPDFMGLFCWNSLNMLLLLLAFLKLPFYSLKSRLLALGFISIELVTATQNAQSNALIAALAVLAWIQFEKKQVFWAAVLIALSAFIKVYGLGIAVLFLFYPNRFKFAIYLTLSLLVLTFLPLVVLPFSELLGLYKNWWELIKNDQSTTWGLSIIGFFYGVLGIALPKSATALVGLLLLMPGLLCILKNNKFRNRLTFCAAFLIWLIVFNFRSESPTYIIAVSGVAIWAFGPLRHSNSRLLLTLLVFLGSSLVTTDLIPFPNKRLWLYDYALKSLPCALVYFKICYDFAVEYYFSLGIKKA